MEQELKACKDCKHFLDHYTMAHPRCDRPLAKVFNKIYGWETPRVHLQCISARTGIDAHGKEVESEKLCGESAIHFQAKTEPKAPIVPVDKPGNRHVAGGRQVFMKEEEKPCKIGPFKLLICAALTVWVVMFGFSLLK